MVYESSYLPISISMLLHHTLCQKLTSYSEPLLLLLFMKGEGGGAGQKQKNEDKWHDGAAGRD